MLTDFQFDYDSEILTFPNILDKKNLSFRKHIIYDIDPVNSDMSDYIRRKIWEVYTRVLFQAIYVSNKYLNIVVDPDNMKDGIQKVNHLVSAIISAYLTKGSSTHLEGAPGCAQTTTVQSISRLMTGSSIDKPKNIVHCDKGTVKESWMGKPNPKELIKPDGTGIWGMTWSDWLEDDNIIDIIFDEPNRGSPDLQASMLEILAQQIAQYDIEFSKSKPEVRIFLCTNPLDKQLGTTHVTDFNFAFKDRITQSLDVPQTDSYAMDRIFKCRKDERFLGFSQDDHTEPIMTTNELRIATILAAKMEIDDDANDFAKYLSRDANICIRCKDYDKTKKKIGHNLCENCKFNSGNSVCQKVTGGSPRMYMQLLKLGRSYAFWLGHKSVTKYLLYAIAPDVISHHLIVNKAKLKEKKKYYGDERLFITKEFIDFCFSKVDDRTIINEKKDKLIKGLGTLNDLEAITEFAKEDLFTQTDILPYISYYQNIKDISDINNNKIDLSDEYKVITDIQKKNIISCADAEYATVMKEVNIIIKQENLEKLTQKLNEIPTMHLRSLIQDKIFAEMHNLIMKNARKEWQSKRE